MRKCSLSFSVFVLLLAACSPNFKPEKIDFENDPRILRGEWTGKATLDHAVRPLIFSPDGSRLFFNKKESKNAIYDMQALAGIATLELSDTPDIAQFSSDNVTLATATAMSYTEKNAISLWDTRTGENLDTFPIEGEVLGFSQNLEQVATMLPVHQFESEEIAVWSVDNQERLYSLSLPNVSERYYSVIEIGPNLSTVATCENQLGEGEPVIKLWTVEEGEERFTSPLRSSVYCASVFFSPDGSLIAVESGVGTQIRDAATGELLADLDGAVRPLAISSDNRRLVSKREPYIFLWDIQAGTKKDILVADSWRSHDQAFDPQLNRLAWDNFGSQLRILDLVSGEVLADIVLSESFDVRLDLAATYVDRASYSVSGTLTYNGETYAVRSDVYGGNTQEYLKPMTSPVEAYIRLEALDANSEVSWILEGLAPYYNYDNGSPQLDEVLFVGDISRPDRSLLRSYSLERQP